MNASHTRLAVQLYTIRDFIKTPAEIPKALQRVRQIGYPCVELGGLPPLAPQELQTMLADAGLVPIGYHTSLKELREQFKALVDKLYCWNVSYVAIAYLEPADRADEAAYEARAREMNNFGRQLAQEHIHLQYHNHNFEFIKFGGRTGLDIIYAESDPCYLQAEIDTCWVARTGADPAAWILRMQGRMDQIHFKDTVMTLSGPQFAEVGEGHLNWPAILAACRAIGVKDYIVEQDSCPATQDPFRSLEISYRNLIAMEAETAGAGP